MSSRDLERLATSKALMEKARDQFANDEQWREQTSAARESFARESARLLPFMSELADAVAVVLNSGDLTAGKSAMRGGELEGLEAVANKFLGSFEGGGG